MIEIWPNAGAAKVEAASSGANNHFTFIVLLRVWSQVPAWTPSASGDAFDGAFSQEKRKEFPANAEKFLFVSLRSAYFASTRYFNASC
jgi:hypothetical protein